MNTKYIDVDLVSNDDPGYRRTVAFYAKIWFAKKKRRPSPEKKSPCTVRFNREITRWEDVLRKLLSKLVPEEKNRILRYNVEGKVAYYSKRKLFKYREIDFIANPYNNHLVFCEIKHKNKAAQSINAKASGWKQLYETIRIASNKYNKISGLSICVDMSHVYKSESPIKGIKYYSYNDIKNRIHTPYQKTYLIWLNSSEIAQLAVKYELLSHEQILNMEKIYKDYVREINKQESK